MTDGLEEYIDLLYDEKKEAKERATGHILEVCVQPGRLEEIVSHSTLMGAISRVLADEHKKSMTVTYNIIRIFLALSNFVQYHRVLSELGVASKCCDVFAYEVRRLEHRREESKKYEALNELEETEVLRSQAIERIQVKLLTACAHLLCRLAEEKSIEAKMVKAKKLPAHLVAIYKYSRSAPLLDITTLFLKKLSNFQEAKDLAAKHSIVKHALAPFIPCSSPQVLSALLGLALNLSFDSDLRNQMLKYNSTFPAALLALVFPPSSTSATKTLKLSAEEQKQFRNSLNYRVCFRILYHLSAARQKSLFIDAVSPIMELILTHKSSKQSIDHAPQVVTALAVNLALSPDLARRILPELPALVSRLKRTGDPLLAKVLRTVSQQTFRDKQRSLTAQQQMQQVDNQLQWPSELVSPIIELVLQPPANSTVDFRIEILGTIGNLSTSDLPPKKSWSDLDKEMNILAFLSSLLQDPKLQAEFDLILEVINVVSAFARDLAAAPLVANLKELRTALDSIWQTSAQKDVEIKLQLLYVYIHLLDAGPESHHAVFRLSTFDLLNELLLCLDHRHKSIVRYADACCDIILEYDRDPETFQLGMRGELIRDKRFRSRYGQWYDQQARM